MKCWMRTSGRNNAFNVLKYCLPSIALIYLFVEWLTCWCCVHCTHKYTIHVFFLCVCVCDKEQPCPINWPPDIYRTYYVCSRCMQPAHHRNNVNFDSFVYETGAHHIFSASLFPAASSQLRNSVLFGTELFTND